MSTSDNPVSPRVAGKKFGVTTRTLRNWVKKGCPVVLTAGAQHRFNLEAVRFWKDAQASKKYFGASAAPSVGARSCSVPKPPLVEGTDAPESYPDVTGWSEVVR